MDSVFWPLAISFFTTGQDPWARTPAGTKLKLLYIQLFLNRQKMKHVLSHLESACFAYPVKPHPAFLEDWLNRAVWF